MVSGQNIAASVVLLVGFAGIFTWMKQNGHTTGSMSLGDACQQALKETLVNQATCEGIEERGLTWDSQLPCIMGFKEDKYYFTLRQGVDAMEEGKGWGDGIIVAAKACVDAAKADADFEAFQTTEENFSVIIGRSEKRNLWWKKKKKKACSIRSDGNCKPGHKWQGGAYRSCSVHLALRFITGANDHADCSGKVGNGGTGSAGNYCWAAYYNGNSGYNRAMNNRERLAAACVEHDRCLSFGGTKNCGTTCDLKLSGSAGWCAVYRLPWVGCTDDVTAAGMVTAAMAIMPNVWSGSNCRSHV